ncbi:MAG: hypothetical protein AB7F86_09635 [Bdellovibrionales bacterium]
MKANLNGSAKLARKLNDDFKTLLTKIGKDRINHFQKVTMLDLADEISNIADELEAKTDGRPDGLELAGRSNASGGPWAECYKRGYDDVALVGGVEVTRDDLLELREWIDSVLKWHGEAE